MHLPSLAAVLLALASQIVPLPPMSPSPGSSQTRLTLDRRIDWGRFVGEVTASWSDDGRNMVLKKPFAYVSPNGYTWDAPEGSIIDGASIPRMAWTIVGGPFEGPYRNASVVHDVACDRKTENWLDVHRAFYMAMRAAHVDKLAAKLMYAAVYHFGPRWPLSQLVKRCVEVSGKEFCNEVREVVMPDEPTLATPEEFQRLSAAIRQREKYPDVEDFSYKGVPLGPGDYAMSIADIESFDLRHK